MPHRPQIGRVTTSNEFDGLIDDVRLYTRPLTPDEVRRTYNIAQPRINVTRTIIADGLVGHWTFDGPVTGPTWTDDISGNGNTGTLVNGPKTTIGSIGQALSFDGNDDSVNMGSPAVLDDLGAMTVSAWINPRSMGQGGDGPIVDKLAAGPTLGGWDFTITDSGSGINRLDYVHEYDTTNLIRRSADNAVNLNEWSHVVLTTTGSDLASDVHIYVNGVEVSYVSSVNGVGIRASDAAKDFHVGSGESPQLSSHNFDGLIDDVRVYNRALTDHEIQRLYNGTKPQEINTTQSTGSLADGLAGHWSFDGPVTGPTWTDDVSGNGNSGTLTNGPQPTAGNIGQAMEFDGSNDYVDSNYGPVFSPADDFSISLWFKFSSAPTSDTTLIGSVAESGAEDERIVIEVDGDGTSCANDSLVVGIGDTDSATNDSICSNSIADTNWHHAAVTYDVDGSLKIFVDGTEHDADAVSSSSNGVKDFSTTDFYIGARNNQGTAIDFFEGRIDDVRIYDRVLTPSEIQRLYRLGGGQ